MSDSMYLESKKKSITILTSTNKKKQYVGAAVCCGCSVGGCCVGGFAVCGSRIVWELRYVRAAVWGVTVWAVAVRAAEFGDLIYR